MSNHAKKIKKFTPTTIGNIGKSGRGVLLNVGTNKYKGSSIYDVKARLIQEKEKEIGDESIRLG